MQKRTPVFDPRYNRVVKLALAAVALVACHRGDNQAGAVASRPTGRTIQVGVIGGMVETGMWQALIERYEQDSGNKVVLASTGPKPLVAAAFRKGGIDLVTFHASDTMVNLVADGLAQDLEPWARNDLIVVGPTEDPAHIRGERDATTALTRIIASKASVVVHASMGADTVLHDLLEDGHLALPAAQTILFVGDDPHEILDRAAEAHAYTLVGRIPFIDGKLKRGGVELMVRGDPKLRRPYLVAIASGPANDPRVAAARDLEDFMCSHATQAWLATFGQGRYDDGALFVPGASGP
jgi:tungstate transport system substrate-binding protein